MAPQRPDRQPYQVIADQLRNRIRAGALEPGAKLPAAQMLAAEHGVNRNTVIRALSVLEGEGLVASQRGRGTYVREQPVRRRITRDRVVHRDDRGYYFDLAVQDWEATHPTEISTRPAPAEVAELLGVNPGVQVLVRYRRLGPPGEGVGQIATSYLPEWIVQEVPQVGSLVTGPGGVYDRIEERGHAPLGWEEVAWSRMPAPEEAAALEMEAGVPVLLLGCVTRSGRDGRIAEVLVRTFPADRFQVAYQLQRSPEAQARLAELGA